MANILIVDDTIVVRKILTKMLTEEGHTIIGEAEDGQKAVSAYKKLRPDLITMDINMPVMNGLDACKAIIQEFPDAKIVVLTAIGSRHSVVEAFKNGAKHYLVKPIEKEKATAVINNVLGNANTNKENAQIQAVNESKSNDNNETSNIKNKMFQLEMLSDRIKITIDLDTAAGNINVFYATMISSLRKLLFSATKKISFNFIHGLCDNLLVESISEIIGLTVDAGMTVEIISENSLVGCLKDKIGEIGVVYINSSDVNG